MTVTLKAGVGAQLGKTGTVKLSELNSSTARNRTFTDASAHYKRVNSNEIANGHAPAPAAGTPTSMSLWEGYEQFNDESDRGSNMDISALDDDSATFTWTLPSGYANFAGNTAMSDVKQDLYVKVCSDQTETENNVEDCMDENPFAGANHGNTDGTTLTASGLNELTWYIGSVRMSWNDRDNTGTYYHTAAETGPHYLGGYIAVASPTGTNTERDSANYDAIVFKTTVAAVCTTTTVGLSTTSGNDGACESCDNWNTNSRTTVKINHAGFAQNKTLYHSSGNCVSGNVLANDPSPPNDPFRWASNNGERAYTLNSGLLGSTANSLDCQDENICEEFGE